MVAATFRKALPASVALGLMMAGLLLLAPSVAQAGSGKHLVPLHFFSREGVKTPADAWRVVRRTQGEVRSALTPELLREARLPLDVMIEALSWMRRRTALATADPNAQAGLRHALSVAIEAAHDLHDDAHRWHGRDWSITRSLERFELLSRALSAVPPYFPPGQIEPRKAR